MYRTNFALMLEYKYAASAAVTGYLISYSGAVGTAAGFVVGRVASFYGGDNARLLFHTSIVTVVSIAGLTYAPTLWGVVLFMTPMAIGNAVARVCVINLTLTRGRGQETGALLGIGASVLSVARMMAPAVGGFAQEVHLSGPALVGVACAVAGVVVQLVVPQRNRNRKETPCEKSELLEKID